MYAKKLQFGDNSLKAPQFNEKIRVGKVKNDGIEIIK